ncbi:uncharacterized protein LOC122665671 [Telopea speciosissima]|uniref:uncharacterized protein LOC122665671 n=1 Tax=Telopea speciosissima TaxID=54955 RepID=UPI001CC38C8D|nr:uncharacterized protein LOC122665671 [Telopea speciosissima]
MEDSNMLAAECIVISCCCPCLILQIIVFLLLRLPYKLLVMSKRFALKTLGKRKKGEKATMGSRDRFSYISEMVRIQRDLLTIQARGIPFNSDQSCECTLSEIEKVLGDLCRQGEFAFGSFWGRDEETRNSPSNIVQDHEESENVVNYQVIEVISSIKTFYNPVVTQSISYQS